MTELRGHQREAEQVLAMARHVLAKRGNVDEVTLNDRLTITIEQGPASCSMLIRNHEGRTVLHAFWNPNEGDNGRPFFATFKPAVGFWKRIIEHAARSPEPASCPTSALH
jgi:hypothetical protein